jgi:CheY-like chemotaxis protein/anti-sigma regulatory factor (Ser/Thr protein kinase)
MRTILVVDDSNEVREVAGSCLRDHGMTPVFAENGRDALDILARRRLDAALTDLHMPEMDGLELVERMRRDYSHVPVVLMTSRGSEKDAFEALRAGALSYVPKRELRGSLCDAMRTVVAAVEAGRHRGQTDIEVGSGESNFVLGYEMEAFAALVSHLQANLEQIECCDDTQLFQVSTALGEALNNAIDHGNLELDSAIREESIEVYGRLRQERCLLDPYRNRRVHVTERINPGTVTYIIRDEGRGFDVSSVPDPRNTENLLKASGRGLMLIRTFMDDVSFNDRGNEITMVKRRASGA